MKFLQLLAPHKSMMTQALFGALIYSVLGLSVSVYVGKITDYVLVDENLNLLNLMSVIMIVLLVLRTFIGSMKSILALKQANVLTQLLSLVITNICYICHNNSLIPCVWVRLSLVSMMLSR